MDKKKITDEYFLYAMIESMDSLCVPTEDTDYNTDAYCYNGAFTEFGMDVKELKNPVFKY